MKSYEHCEHGMKSIGTYIDRGSVGCASCSVSFSSPGGMAICTVGALRGLLKSK
jgi:hypothetical protein